MPVAATELEVLLNPFTIIESGSADIEDKRVESITGHGSRRSRGSSGSNSSKQLRREAGTEISLLIIRMQTNSGILVVMRGRRLKNRQ